MAFISAGNQVYETFYLPRVRCVNKLRQTGQPETAKWMVLRDGMRANVMCYFCGSHCVRSQTMSGAIRDAVQFGLQTAEFLHSVPDVMAEYECPDRQHDIEIAPPRDMLAVQ